LYKKGELKNLSVQPQDLKWIIIVRYCGKIMTLSLPGKESHHCAVCTRAYFTRAKSIYAAGDRKTAWKINLIQIYLNASVL
jgi:hypothetical protein